MSEFGLIDAVLFSFSGFLVGLVVGAEIARRAFARRLKYWQDRSLRETGGEMTLEDFAPDGEDRDG